MGLSSGGRRSVVNLAALGARIVGLVTCGPDTRDVISNRSIVYSSSGLSNLQQGRGRLCATAGNVGVYTTNRLDWPDWQVAAPMSFFAYWQISSYTIASSLDLGYAGASDGYWFGEQFGTGNRNYGAGGKVVAPGTTWPLNTPILTVLTYDGSTVTGYCNGVSDGSTGGGAALSYGSFDRLFAGCNPDGHGFNGTIYYMGITTGMISPAAIRAFANDPYKIFAQPTRSMWFVPASSNNTLAAPLGTLTLTGLVPAITQGNSLTAPLGTLTLTGLVPTITQGNSVTAPMGTLTLTGLVPTFTQPINLIAPLGTMTLTGLVPTFVQGGNQSITAPLGTLTLTGLAPTFDQTSSSGTIVVGSGPGKKRKRHILEIDGELFEVRDLQHAEQILAQVRQLADENAARIAKTATQDRPAKVELPKIATNFAPAQAQVDQTQAMIRSLYEAAAKGEQMLLEMQRLRDEDDDDAIAVLFL